MVINQNTMKISVEQAMMSLHETLSTDMREDEFTTSEYADQNKINISKAYRELKNGVVKGIVECRRTGNRNPLYWRMGKNG